MRVEIAVGRPDHAVAHSAARARGRDAHLGDGLHPRRIHSEQGFLHPPAGVAAPDAHVDRVAVDHELARAALNRKLAFHATAGWIHPRNRRAPGHVRPGEGPNPAVTHRDAVAPHFGLADRLEARTVWVHPGQAPVPGECPHARVAHREAGRAQVQPALVAVAGVEARDSIVPADPQRVAVGEQVMSTPPDRIAVSHPARTAHRPAPRVDPGEQRQVVLHHPYRRPRAGDQARREAVAGPVVAVWAGGGCLGHLYSRFRSQSRRSPVNVSRSSTSSISSQKGAIEVASPPVAIVMASTPSSSRSRATIPSTWPAKP